MPARWAASTRSCWRACPESTRSWWSMRSPSAPRRWRAHVGGRSLEHDPALDQADAVVIATPAHLHAMTVEAAIARGIPALCEKPLTDDATTSAELVARVERASAHVEVGFHRRHDPAYAEARRRVADGSVGRLHLLRLTAFDPRVDPAARQRVDAERDGAAVPPLLDPRLRLRALDERAGGPRGQCRRQRPGRGATGRPARHRERGGGHALLGRHTGRARIDGAPSQRV